MEIQINIYTLEKLLAEAAEMGARAALSRIGKLRPYLKNRKRIGYTGEGMLKPG